MHWRPNRESRPMIEESPSLTSKELGSSGDTLSSRSGGGSFRGCSPAFAASSFLGLNSRSIDLCAVF